MTPLMIIDIRRCLYILLEYFLTKESQLSSLMAQRVGRWLIMVMQRKSSIKGLTQGGGFLLRTTNLTLEMFVYLNSWNAIILLSTSRFKSGEVTFHLNYQLLHTMAQVSYKLLDVNCQRLIGCMCISSLYLGVCLKVFARS